MKVIIEIDSELTEELAEKLNKIIEENRFDSWEEVIDDKY